MNTKRLLACIAALAALNTVHAAGIHEIANAPSLMSSKDDNGKRIRLVVVRRAVTEIAFLTPGASFHHTSICEPGEVVLGGGSGKGAGW